MEPTIMDMSVDTALETLSKHFSNKLNRRVKVNVNLKIYKPGYHEDDDVRVDFYYLGEDGKNVYIYPEEVQGILSEYLVDNYELNRMIYVTDIDENKENNKKTPRFDGIRLFVKQKGMKL